MNRTVNRSRFEDSKAGLTARLSSSGEQHGHRMEILVAGVLSKIGADSVRQKVTASMKNVLDGDVLSAVRCIMGTWPVTFEVKGSIANGEVSLDEKAIKDSLDAALKAVKEAPRATAIAAKMPVDLSSISAARVGDIVSFRSAELPEWGLTCRASDMMDDNIKKLIPGRVVASLRGYCLTQFDRVAEFSQPEFKLPVVAAVVMRKPEPALPPDWNIQAAISDQLEQASIGHSIAASMDFAQPSAEHRAEVRQPRASDGARSAFETDVRSQLEPLATSWLRAELKADNPVVQMADMSGVQENGGRRSGSAVFSFKFYGRFQMEEATIEVPYDTNGQPNVLAINRTKADLQAEEDRRKKLQILSDEDREKKLKQFKADQAATAGRLKAMGLEAAQSPYNSNWSQGGPANMVPIRKTALPEEYSKPGVKLMVDGAIYEIEATDWNSVSAEHNTFWMLRLKPELSASDADFNYHVYAAADALSGIGKK